MSSVWQYFQPPLYWQQFEELCVELLGEVYDVPNAQQVGRPGQAQNGIDVFGQSARHGRIGIQCKRLSDLDEHNNPYPGGPITRAFLRAEAKKALAFKHDLKLWILATTARRDTKVQEWVEELNDEWQQAGRDRIAIVWTWDECISHLNSYPNLQRKYYRDVIQVCAPKDLDEIILRTIAMAFARPAFEVPLHCETPSDFFQALKDTQKALRTGELVDRESRHVIRKAIGGYHELDDSDARASLGEVDKNLKILRTHLEQGLKDKTIRTVGTYLDIREPALARYLEELRQRCLDDLNRVLQGTGIPTI
ncbi:hypothetical protein [Limoniibacter endophyticus]|uniref:Restriction endonuclease n=1 Tax=Limoniibacter endophyticus TaxID=1565040 RepID=A0A8J3DIP5_9HYPH|nr:hypothetical protein [Limoniibacter endophyticus]GHC71031.1 hypothetical protein GCM10010136_17900 [Limoniibacter endophyticus]